MSEQLFEIRLRNEHEPFNNCYIFKPHIITVNYDHESCIKHNAEDKFNVPISIKKYRQHENYALASSSIKKDEINNEQRKRGRPQKKGSSLKDLEEQSRSPATSKKEHRKILNRIASLKYQEKRKQQRKDLEIDLSSEKLKGERLDGYLKVLGAFVKFLRGILKQKI